MLNRKQTPKISPDEQALENRVDAIMNSSPKLPSSTTTESIDIFQDPRTATDVPSGLLEQIGATKIVEAAGSTELDDIATDKAVDAISTAEATDSKDTPHDFSTPKRLVHKPSKWRFLKNKWLWTSLVLFIVILFSVPFTRYKLLGLIIKEPYLLTVMDSKTDVAVSGAHVKAGSTSGVTDANGHALMKLPIGSTTLVITKQYFKGGSQKIFVGLNGKHQSTVQLVATGRQVPVKVVNALTGKPLGGVTIEISGTNARTDSAGLATIVLPASIVSKKADLSASGYNPLSVDIEVGGALLQNTFKLSPVGKLYYLSNSDGKINIVKSNLDGTERKVVLAGTGKEDVSTTLLASRDWRFLVLKAKRDSDKSALYVLDTETDKTTQFESGSADLSLIGWYGHTILYDAVKNSSSLWQPGREVIKSYNAESEQLNLLDQNQAEGAAASYGYQSFANFQVSDNAIVFTTSWTASGGYDISGKTAAIRSMQPGGQNKKDLQTFPESSFSSITAVHYAPQAIYYGVVSSADNSTTYYEYHDSGVTANTNIDQATFQKSYPTYLLSPTGAQSVWADPGSSNNLFVGDNNGKRSTQLGSGGGYTPYGWYGEGYVLATKNGNNLYIIAPTDSISVKKPFRITDYYKSAQTMVGNGYSYGGL